MHRSILIAITFLVPSLLLSNCMPVNPTEPRLAPTESNMAETGASAGTTIPPIPATATPSATPFLPEVSLTSQPTQLVEGNEDLCANAFYPITTEKTWRYRYKGSSSNFTTRYSITQADTFIESQTYVSSLMEKKWTCTPEGLIREADIQAVKLSTDDAYLIDADGYVGVTIPDEELWVPGYVWESSFSLKEMEVVSDTEKVIATGYYLSHSSIGQPEEVTVAAGTFREAYPVEQTIYISLKIDLAGSYRRQSRTFHVVTWHVKDVGIIKMTTTSNDTPDSTYELVSIESSGNSQEVRTDKRTISPGSVVATQPSATTAPDLEPTSTRALPLPTAVPSVAPPTPRPTLMATGDGNLCANAFYPVAAGRTWTFRAQADAVPQSEYTLRYSDMEADSFVEQRSLGLISSTNHWSCLPEGLFSEEFTSSVIGVTDQAIRVVTTASDGITIPAETLWVQGYTWDSSYSLEESTTISGTETVIATGYATLHSTLAEPEEITVPAGAFSAHRADQVFYINLKFKYQEIWLRRSYTMKVTAWYARGVGLVKSMTTSDDFGNSFLGLLSIALSSDAQEVYTRRFDLPDHGFIPVLPSYVLMPQSPL